MIVFSVRTELSVLGSLRAEKTQMSALAAYGSSLVHVLSMSAGVAKS